MTDEQRAIRRFAADSKCVASSRKSEKSSSPPSAPTIDDLAYRPFPVAALPEPVRGIVTAGSKAIGCDESYVALPLLVALASAIGLTRRLEIKRSWYVPPILWGAIVGESGTAKTPAARIAFKPVQSRQKKALARYEEAMKKYALDKAIYDKDFQAWKRDKNGGEPPDEPPMPVAERCTVSDATIESLAPILKNNPRGVLVARDELNGWIGSFDRYAAKGRTGSDSANWLSMHSGECITVDRKTGIPPTLFVPHAAVWIVGGIQPGILTRALGTEHRECGLAARLLLVFPPRKAKRWTEADIDPEAEAELVRLFERLYALESVTDEEGDTRPLLVKLSQGAKSSWTAYYDTHANEAVELSGEMAAAWSKLEECAARLALVIHFIRWAAGKINDEMRLDQ